MGSAHRDQPKSQPSAADVPGGWKLPDDFDQRSQPEPMEPEPAPESSPEQEQPQGPPAAPLPPPRDTRLDGFSGGYAITQARMELKHLEGFVDCQCVSCWDKSGFLFGFSRRKVRIDGEDFIVGGGLDDGIDL